LCMLSVPGSVDALRTEPRIIAPADRLVAATDPAFAELPRQLLGRTLLVTNLEAARALAARAHGYRFLTPRGELLEADGTLTVGAAHAEAGLLSRKSELRELRNQASDMDRQLAAVEAQLVQLRNEINAGDSHTETLQREIEVLAEQAADLRSRLEQ